jgi:hypothetical protein
MQRLTLYNKREWVEGPWQSEADLVRWMDNTTGLPCFAIREEHSGVFCGYVGVNYRHPLYRTFLNDPTYNFIDVHGGVSFADFIRIQDAWVTPREHRWWIGFDCYNEFDFSPLRTVDDDPRIEYRDEIYVREQIAGLAQQLHMMEY